MQENNPIKVPRRKFLFWLIPLGGSALGLLLFKGLYTDSWRLLFSKKVSSLSNSGGGRKSNRKKTKALEEYQNSTLVLNTKTNVVHLRTKQLFTYYDKILKGATVSFENWESVIANNNTHFVKGKSGVIFEHLSLKNLSNGFSPDVLEKSIEILSKSFSKEYYLQNVTNWRLYDLLLKYFAFSEYTIDRAWASFSEIIKNVDLTYVKVPKKNKWIKSRDEFERRIKHAIDNRSIFTKKLQERIIV